MLARTASDERGKRLQEAKSKLEVEFAAERSDVETEVRDRAKKQSDRRGPGQSFEEMLHQEMSACLESQQRRAET